MTTSRLPAGSLFRHTCALICPSGTVLGTVLIFWVQFWRYSGDDYQETFGQKRASADEKKSKRD